jgi:[FeFe] hydrogenase H-cluster maturation GTPase HydF
MAKAPRGERLIIAIIGKRNAGKSSLINAIIGQQISIVSDVAGTTTDPVAKHYELLPLGPVTFYDTAGFDDVGKLGEQRIKATYKILWKSDIAVIVIDEKGMDENDYKMIDRVKDLKIPFLIVFNKSDINKTKENDLKYCDKNRLQYMEVSSKTGENINSLKEKIISLSPKELKKEKVLLSDLIKEGETVVLVVPIDLAAPKGRLILPQVQSIREILDSDAISVVVKERELESALNNFKSKPAIVITDSQAVLKVSADVPEDIPLTTFSILFARYKGDLKKLIEGANKIDKLKEGDSVLIAEACSHHVQADDIGRVKIPRWLLQYTGKELKIDIASGSDYPENLEEYSLIIHCGGCMLNRMEMMRRIKESLRRKTSITNYGVAISKLQGVLERVIKPFYG